VNGTKHLALLGLAISLSSCAVLRPDNSSPPGTAPAPARPTAQTMAAQGVVEGSISSDAQAGQQRLIDEINRNGSALESAGLRETAPTPVTAPADDVVELNYEQADLRIVLEELADAVDATIIIDPTIADKISIRTSANRPLSQADIWPLMRLLTRQAGVTLERVGDVYYARKSESNLPQEIVFPGAAGVSASAMQITPLTYISVDSAVAILQPLVEPDGRIARITNSNNLAISGTSSQLGRINELLAIVDTDPFQNQGLRVYPLNNVGALEMAEELQEVLTMIEGENPAYQVLGLERINALLVTAPAVRGFDEIGRWVRLLDADQQEQAEQLFNYRVKNLTATELAETLTNVFDLDEDEAAIERNQREPAQTVDIINPDGQTVTRTITPGQPASVSANLKVTIVADEATNSLLVRANPRDYRQLLTTINQLDQVPLQVMINAVIAQITLTEETRFGVDWSRVADNAAVDPISTSTSTSFLPNGGLGGLMFTKSFLDGAARVEATLEAIATNNDVRLLARPSLTVSNNMEGEIRIGSQVPILGETRTTESGDNFISSVQYRDTGIELAITPRINDDGVVNLTITQNLSSLAEGLGVRDNPIFQNQEITTTVVVRNGENIVLGGLIQSNNGDLNTGVPFLNRVPVLGRLFSYQQDTTERQELFIVLRPEVVNLNQVGNAQYAEILQRFELMGELIRDAGL